MNHSKADTTQPASATAATGALSAAIDRVRQQANAAIVARLARLTVDAPVWGGNTITIPEPSWCTLDHSKLVYHPEDLYHTGIEMSASMTHSNGEQEELIAGWLTENPYSGDGLRAAVALQGGDVEDYDEDGLARLAGELHAAAVIVERLRARLVDARLASEAEAS
ncbi:hypothetical protein BX265_4730 [Streptomyces sp. TLI_235]|nr:hypothetical protein [Streptomyces sp. TLI_235]PBC79901.1 hypothetical protein BX265_4730 [Streptomyces sp. TLI_235]